MPRRSNSAWRSTGEYGTASRPLEFAGEAADSVVIQAPHRSAVEWSLGHAYAGARKAGRDPAHLLEHYDESALPEALVTGFPDGFRSDYSEHITSRRSESTSSRGCPEGGAA